MITANRHKNARTLELNGFTNIYSNMALNQFAYNWVIDRLVVAPKPTAQNALFYIRLITTAFQHPTQR